MLVLLFYLGDTMYTMKCDRVKEVAPIVKLKKIPQAPHYVSGLFNYRGVIVPVVDLRLLIQGEPCRMRMSTRIILVDYSREQGSTYVLGLMAERVTETARRDDSAFLTPGLQMEDAPYLGTLMMQDKEMIQYVDLDLLPESIKLLPALENGQHEPE